MYKRLILVISIILLFGAASVEAAPIREWYGTDTNHRWDDANNWKDETLSGIASVPGPGYIVNIRHGGGAPYDDYVEIDAVHCTGVNEVNIAEIHFGYKDAIYTGMTTGPDDAMIDVNGGTIMTTAKNSFRLGYGLPGDFALRNKMLVRSGSTVDALFATGFGIRPGQVWAHENVYEQTGGTVTAPRLTMDNKTDQKTTGNMAYLSGGTLTLTSDPTVPLHPNNSTFYTRRAQYGADGGYLEMTGGTLIFSHALATIAYAEGLITLGWIDTPPGWSGRQKWSVVDTGDIEVTVQSYFQGAWNFDPPTGSRLDRYDTTFTWNEGTDMNGPMNVIYWSTNKADVDAGAPAAWDSNSLTPILTASPMILDTMYYLRVDEEDTISGEVFPGPTLQYTCRDFVELDRVEGYLTDPCVSAVWNDAYSIPAHKPGGDNIADSTRVEYPVREIWESGTPIEISTEAMQLYYDGGISSGDSSEIMRDYGAGNLQDVSIASGGIKALVIYFHGDDGNGKADPFYCALEDADTNDAVAYYPDNNDLEQGIWSMLWHEFNIDLADFTAAGVDLTRIQKVYLGLGNYAAGTGTAFNSGKLYLDDMGYYPSRCVYAEGPIADFYFQRDGVDYYDCTVGNEDLKIMGDSWLASAPGTVTAALGTTASPIAMWKLDETTGTYAYDTAGYDSNDYKLVTTDDSDLSLHTYSDPDIANVHPLLTPGNNQDVTQFNGAFRMTMKPPSSQMPALWGHFTDGITFSMWAKGTDYWGTVYDWPGSGCMVGSGRVADASARMINVTFPQKYQLEVGNFLWRAGDSDLNASSPDDYDDCRWNENYQTANFQGQWNHLAVTKDTTTGIMTNYVNGVIVEQESGKHTDFNPMLADPVANFGVGGDNDTMANNPYYGYMYDVRLYAAALPQDEILFLAGVASVTQPLMLQGDADGDNDVDLGDYAVLANTFLDVALWP